MYYRSPKRGKLLPQTLLPFLNPKQEPRLLADSPVLCPEGEALTGFKLLPARNIFRQLASGFRGFWVWGLQGRTSVPVGTLQLRVDLAPNGRYLGSHRGWRGLGSKKNL